MLLAWVPIPLKKWLSSFLLAVLGSQGIVVKCPADIFFFIKSYFKSTFWPLLVFMANTKGIISIITIFVLIIY